MVRAAFFNKSLVNFLCMDAPIGHTVHVPSNRVLPIWEAANAYRNEHRSVVIVAGERYGMGSSRDWAAKGQRLLGVRAVLAVGFERIHRSNLIGMGILPLILPRGTTPKTLNLQVGDAIAIAANGEGVSVRGGLPIRIIRVNQRVEEFTAMVAVDTKMELELLRYGGVIPMILQKTISTQ